MTSHKDQPTSSHPSKDTQSPASAETRPGCIGGLVAGFLGGEVKAAALASVSRQALLQGENKQMLVTTMDHWPQDIEVGELFVTVVVRAANVVSDIRENIRNLVGGRMKHYEAMIQRAAEEAIEETQRKAREAGYDGVMGLKMAHPTVVEGGVELIVYGNGFRYRNRPTATEAPAQPVESSPSIESTQSVESSPSTEEKDPR